MDEERAELSVPVDVSVRLVKIWRDESDAEVRDLAPSLPACLASPAVRASSPCAAPVVRCSSQ